MTRENRARTALLVLLVLTIVRVPLAWLMPMLLPDMTVAPEVNYIASIAQSVLLFALPGWLLMRGTKPEPIGEKRQLDWLLAAIAVSVLARPALTTLNALWCGLLSLETSMIPPPQGLVEQILQVFALAVVPAVGEELFFRGALLRQLQAEYGRCWALWLTSLLFALMHGSLAGLPGHLVIGLLLTLLGLHSGGLLAPIAAHMVYNLLPFRLERGALGTMILLAVLLAWLIRRVPAGGERPRKREGLVLGLILAAMTAQYFL